MNPALLCLYGDPAYQNMSGDAGDIFGAIASVINTIVGGGAANDLETKRNQGLSIVTQSQQSQLNTKVQSLKENLPILLTSAIVIFIVVNSKKGKK